MIGMAKDRKLPDWFSALDLTLRERDRLLASFTPHRDGYVRWYKGKVRFVCGKSTPPAEVAGRWDEKRRGIDGESPVKFIGRLTVRDGLARFFEYLDHRVEHGQPEPLSETTRMDYQNVLALFGGTRIEGAKIADRPLAGVGPLEFTAFAKTLAGKSPSTLARHVAYVQAFFRFCADELLIDHVPQWGRYFIKPGKQEHRDVRLTQKKSFTPDEIRKLLAVATVEERAWILLGLNCGFDNSDLAHLTRGVVGKLTAGSLDFRRRKVGRVMRVCPLWQETIDALKAYERPEPAPGVNPDLFFLTPGRDHQEPREGFPLGRVMLSRSGKPHRIDYVAMRWTRLMRRASLRPKSRRLLVCAKCGKPRPKPRGWCECGERDWKRKEIMAGESSADRRGFRALRTTFSNLAPRGFRDEVEIIMGHGRGVLLENYIEEHGVEALRELVEAIRHKLLPFPKSVRPSGASPKGVGGRFVSPLAS